MSQTTKKKHVVKEVLSNYVTPAGDQQIVKVVCGRGNNLHEVETADGDRFLASMPTKFRKNVWIKRGDFLMVEPIKEGDKVKAEIAHILYKDQVRYIKAEGRWPAAFEQDEKCDDKSKNSDDCSDDDDELFVNTNRPDTTYSSDSSSSEED